MAVHSLLQEAQQTLQVPSFTLDSLLSVSKGLMPTMLHSEYEAALNKSFDWVDNTDFHSPRKSQSFQPMVASLDSHMLQRYFIVTYYQTSVSSITTLHTSFVYVQ